MSNHSTPRPTGDAQVVELASRRETSIAFQRLESALPAGKPVEQIIAILDRDDAEDYIKTIPAHTFFHLIKDAGFDQGMDLIPYASPEQLQVFVDLDCWRKDTLDIRRLAPWLAVMVTDADDEHFHKAFRELDPEVVALFFKKNFPFVDVIESEDDLVDLPENAVLSPDNAYALVYPEDEDMAALLRAIVDRLYEVDQALAWTLFEAVRWELTAPMEETAYKFRTSRLEEFGFVDRIEALQVYASINAVKLRSTWEEGRLQAKPVLEPPELLDLPAVVRDSVEREYFFFQALDTIEDPALASNLIAELAALHNRTMVADGIEPGEIETGHEVVRRTTGFLSLGLEFFSRANLETAHTVLETLSLITLFQVGYSITTNLQKKAKSLTQRPTLSLVEGVPFSLLNADDAAIFEGLTDLRPTYAEDRHTFDIFHRQAQVDTAALRLGLVAFKQLWLFGVVGKTVEELAPFVYEGLLLNEPDMVSFDVFFATALSTHLLHQEPALRGLTANELRVLPEALRAQPWGEDPIGFFEPLIGPILIELPAATTGLATRWLKETLDWLTDELAMVTDYIGPEPFLELVLVAHPAHSG